MASIIEVLNPFKPLEDTNCHQHPGGITIRGWLKSTYPGFREFSHPTVCTVNGEAKLRSEWNEYEIKPNDVVNFVVMPGDPYTLIYILYAVIIVAAVAVVLTMPKPKIPGTQPSPDPVYDIKGQTNQNRFGSPIEVPYGYCRLYPSYAARSYNVYEGNNQYQYSLYSLGQGYFAIDKIQYEDTDISNFQDVTYTVYQPGDSVTAFPDNVITSVDAIAIELKATNEPDYAIFGPFSVCGSGETASRIQVDVVLPAGLYHAGNDGTLEGVSVEAKWEYRQIDNSGAPVGGGAWSLLFDFNKSLATVTPQRFTLSADVMSARYEVRAYRVGNKFLDSAYGNTVVWDAMRGFLPPTTSFGNVTLVAVKARATNNLNDSSSQRFNVWATRKLRTWNVGSQSWNAVTATRNPVWAFCDVFQATYGGQLADRFLALDELATFAATFETESRHFDFVFDQPSTVWEAAQTIARVARCIPIPNISQITMVRDVPKTVPTAVFTPDNMVKGSFNWEIKLANISDYDGVEVTYTDPLTFKDATVLCLVGADEGNNPEQIRLAGCCDRTLAYREGMYIRATRLYNRENINFSTELEGHIPTYGDLISVAHDLPRWGSFGLIKAIAGDNKTLTLSEPVTFSGSCVIGLRKKDGTLSGPHACTSGSDAYTVVLGIALTDTFFFDDIHEEPYFQFGPTDAFSKLCTVTSLTPGDDNTVDVIGVPYTDDVFAHDSDSAPGDTGGNTPNTGLLPTMTCESLNQKWEPFSDGEVRVSWSPAVNATSYHVEITNDGTNWIDCGYTGSSSMIVNAIPGADFQAKVTPIGVGSVIGQSCTSLMATGFKPDAPPLPPPGGGPQYPDYFPKSTLLPATASVSATCKSRGGTVTLTGYSEFTSPSTPPKKYLKATFSGNANTHGYTDTSCTSADEYCSNTASNSGSNIWDPVTGTETQTGQHVVSGTCPGTGTFTITDLTAGGPGDTLTVTQTTKSVTNDLACHLDGGGTTSQKRTSQPTYAMTLSNEYTDSDALDNFKAALTDWGSVSAGSCSGVVSNWGVRTSGFSYPYEEAKLVLSGGGYYGSWDYYVDVLFESSSDNGTTWSTYATNTYTLPSDSSGNFSDYEIDYPQTQGVMFRVASYTLHV